MFIYGSIYYQQILINYYELRHESMVDLVALLNELVDEKGKILIPGVYDSVKPLTEEERKLYEPIDFSQVKSSVN